uniref:Uncharacterized protein n=1 Tax=Arundo donax TaxID=35708 RepID=A0A0A9FTI2_ARUDO
MVSVSWIHSKLEIYSCLLMELLILFYPLAMEL